MAIVAHDGNRQRAGETGFRPRPQRGAILGLGMHGNSPIAAVRHARRCMKMGNYHVTGLDISKTFVEIASKNAKEEGIKVNFIEGDASNMPFDNKTFDFIVCTAAFKNFTKPIMAINEMYRVLKPNGKALIIDLRRDASKDAINDNIKDMDMNWINSLFTKLTFRTFLLRNAYTISEIKNLVSKTNFQEYKIPNNPMEFELWLEK